MGSNGANRPGKLTKPKLNPSEGNAGLPQGGKEGRSTPTHLKPKPAEEPTKPKK